MRGHTIAVGCSWDPFLSWCDRTLAQTSVQLWFFNTIRLRLYAAHRVQQRSRTVRMSVMRRLCHTVLANIGALESIYRSFAALTATIAGAHLSHLQLVHQRYCTRAAMVVYRLRDKERWFTATMCDMLQLN